MGSRERSLLSVLSPASSLRATESGNVPSGKSFFRNWRRTMLGPSAPLAVAHIVALVGLQVLQVDLRSSSPPPSSSSSCLTPSSSSLLTHPTSSTRNQPSSYGLFSLESTYILITIKLQVIKLLCECTLSDFDIINNYLHIHYKSHFECVGLQSLRFLSPSLPLAPKTKPKACF